MKNYTVRRYEANDYALWNAFVSSAKNATFLFHRDFMEYHSDRFSDYSLLVFEQDKLISILPANVVGTTIFSHQGLTYGGFVFDAKIKLGKAITIIKTVLQFLHENQITTVQLKLLPAIYQTAFSEEVEYALFLTKAQLIRRDCLSVMDMKQPFSFTKGRKHALQRSAKKNLTVKEETDFDLFWNTVLIPNLDKKHKAKPVHTAQEMAKLQQYFPQNIRQFNVYYEGNIVAGTTVFVTDRVAHSQYISGNDQKSELGSLDFLHYYLLTEVFADKAYFDFGTSHEDNGQKINEGLLYWKESFGAKTTVQDFYEVPTANFSRLENVLI
ncbi:GNAT family N-acetyltransferase [Flavobacterium silvisoli]|uniref:GNAT family N-acetyltransferase n=1 Tax=Flavobacterium silvisoli TaxID=2529433 RepID=A0A4Q9Z0N9_9FLAO|nr:GNAT family N-acetyltransferase [Flavobacterium silvisoli]TBX68743.1 GNAT family N-acetyltransferase [Flavobacterium silvisoli]